MRSGLRLRMGVRVDQGQGITPRWREPLALREGLLGTAATLLFFLAVALMPLAGVFVGFFTPLPILLFTYRWGPALGLGLAGGTALAGGVLLASLNLTASIPLFSGLVLLGVMLALGMRSIWSPEKTIGLSSLVLFGLGGTVFLLSHDNIDQRLFSTLEQELVDVIGATLRQQGKATPEILLLEEALKSVAPMMVRLIPGIAASTTLMTSWLNVLVALRIIPLRRLSLPPWQDWSLWKAPELLVWPVIAAGFMLLVPMENFNLLGMNALLVLGTVYLFQGLAVVGFFFDRWKLHRVFRGMLYALFLLQQFLTLGVALMGLFDTWFDFRRLIRKPSSSNGYDEDEE